jgi:hypothetical protein
MAELQKHPYHSISFCMLIHVRNLALEYFSMKESAKLHRSQKEREKEEVGKATLGTQ